MKTTDFATTTTTTGSKHAETEGLDVAAVAKLIRADLKAAGFKASVRISRYSMGQSIDVIVTAVPKNVELASLVTWQLYTGNAVEFVSRDQLGRDGWFRPAGEMLEKVKEIVNAYNSVTRGYDYTHSRFHERVDLSVDLRDAAIEAAIVAKLVGSVAAPILTESPACAGHSRPMLTLVPAETDVANEPNDQIALMALLGCD